MTIDKAKEWPHIVALAGIDGAGKSSSLHALQTDFRLPRCAFVHKRKRHCVDSIMAAFAGVQNEPERYLRGTFAHAVRWAHAFDFLRFFEEEVVPLEGPASCIVSDRWTVCSAAYAAEGPELDRQVNNLLACVPPADVLIFLEVEPQEAIKRIRRTREPHPDEALSLLHAFAKGYEKVLPSSPSLLVRLNTSDFQTTVRDLAGIIELTSKCSRSHLAQELKRLPLRSRSAHNP
jgi:thymidylate kinase